MDEMLSFHAERRRSPRKRNQHATTHFGEVFDLSAVGMKVFRKSSTLVEIDQELNVELQCENLRAEVQVRVVRRECVGFRRHVYGVEFINLDEDCKERIRQLVDAACDPCACPSCWIAA